MEKESKWSQKYKNSIDCSNPKGFSQRAHCQGLKKKKKSKASILDSLISYYIWTNEFFYS